VPVRETSGIEECVEKSGGARAVSINKRSSSVEVSADRELSCLGTRRLLHDRARPRNVNRSPAPPISFYTDDRSSALLSNPFAPRHSKRTLASPLQPSRKFQHKFPKEILTHRQFDSTAQDGGQRLQINSIQCFNSTYIVTRVPQNVL
jgi:hypothetical protein